MRYAIVLLLPCLLLVSCASTKEMIKVPNEVDYTLHRTWEAVSFVGKIMDGLVDMTREVVKGGIEFLNANPAFAGVAAGLGMGLL